MGTSTQSVFEFNGSVVGLTAGDLLDTNLLNTGSGPLQSTITDNDGFLSQDDDGVSRFTLQNGSVEDAPIDYIGSGTMSTLQLLGLSLDSRPVAAFSANGQIYLIAPNGFPLLSGVSISFDIDPNAPFALDTFVPCFAAGTSILTDKGCKRVEDVKVGDLVLDHDSVAHRVLWRGSRIATDRETDAPVKIPHGFLGPQVPAADTMVSQQHRVVVYLPENRGEPVFVRAKLLLDEGADLVTDHGGIEYHHLLFSSHIVLIANGMPTESLLVASGTRESFGQSAWEQILDLRPDAQHADEQPCLREIRRGELQRRRKQLQRMVATSAPQTLRENRL